MIETPAVRAPDPLRSDAAVLLVSMPWTSLDEPSLGLGLLKAVLAQHGVACRVLHLNLFALDIFKSSTYTGLSHVFALNDFMFGGTLDPEVTHDQLRWLRVKVAELLAHGTLNVREFGGTQGVIDALLQLRAETIPNWLAKWADEIAAQPARLVGFTCMFDQTIASLAMAKLVAQRAPDKTLALGGYAVRTPTAPMILRACPWIDAICDGEGEHVVAALARAAAGEVPLSSVKGIVYRSRSGCVLSTPPPPAVDLEGLPPPDYSDFYADIERLSTEFMVDVAPRGLPIENSRGCWWGEKNHCVFCGIHDDDMAYRHKSAASVIQTLDTLHARHAPFAFRFADYILPNAYYTTLLPELARRGAPYRLECELKANLKEAQVSLLSKAGFLAVQPGIESFSTPVLTAMRKGVSAAQNVFTLLLGRRYQIDIYYNLLYGFPGDEAADYATMVRQLPRLFHLGAPVTCLPVQITRFAPLHARPEAFGIERAEPEPCYDLVFSADFRATSGFDMADFAYYFERPFENAPKLQCLYADMDDIAAAWRQRGPQRAWLCLKRDAASGDMRVHDGRLEAETVYAIEPALLLLLAHCRQPTPRAAVCAAAGLGAAALTLIDRLDQLGLVFCDGDRVLSLVDDETQAAHPAQLAPPAHAASSTQAAEIQDYAA